MNTKTIAFGILVCLAVGCSRQTEAPKPVLLKDDKEKTSYAIGINMGLNYRRQGIDLDYDALTRGFKDAYSGGSALMTEAAVREALNNFQQQLAGKQQERIRQLAASNKQQGEAFLAENKSKPGVVTLPSGLQYKIIREGAGPVPKPDENVTVNYRGTFIDGTEFDNFREARPASDICRQQPVRVSWLG
jgi:FKBP-type peptidyl-prolyl cis-trans isomerase